MVVDNRGGVNGVIAMRAAVKAQPDGHTLIFANSSTTSINPALYANVGYDSRKDFVPIGHDCFDQPFRHQSPAGFPGEVGGLSGSPAPGKARRVRYRHFAARQRLASRG